MGKIELYVGTYVEPLGHVPNGKGRGIEIFQFDTDHGTLSALPVQEGCVSHTSVAWNPTWITVHPHRPLLFAVEETAKYNDNGGISSFHIKENGRLEFINRVSAKGTFPCHCSVDATGNFLIATNYGSGNAPLVKINSDGSLSEAIDVLQNTSVPLANSRQDGPHAHQCVIDAKNNVFVVDLGINAVVQSKLDENAGKLILNSHSPKVTFHDGAGPRHMQFHPKDPFAFVLHELDSTISVCRHDPSTATLTIVATTSTLLPGFTGESNPAEIIISSDGKFVYTSNRGPDNISIFKYCASAPHLELIGHASTEGSCPRHFLLSPDGRFLLAANQNSDSIVIFRVDQATGLLEKAHSLAVGTPVCLAFSHHQH